MDAKTLRHLAGQCQQLARHFGDRQNRMTELTPDEAKEIVTRSLNAGNVLEQFARQMEPPTPEESCPNNPPPESPAPPT